MAFIASFTSPFTRLRTLRLSRRWHVTVLLLVAALLVYMNAFRLIDQITPANLAYAASSNTSTISSVRKTRATTSTATPAPAAAQTSPTSTAPVTPTPSVAAPALNCVPSTYAVPDAIDLSNRPTGLTQVVDSPSQYQIYGNTANQLRAQIQRCAPKQSSNDSLAEFTAQTGFQITWRYSYTSTGDGTCRVANAKIGVHLAMTLPLWQSTNSAVSGLPDQWSNYMKALTTHEQGHIDLGERYAAQMLQDLQNFPATNCATIEASINAVMQQDIGVLNTANDRYDSDTNHGATQGANLPS